MSYLDTLADRPLTKRELEHKEQTAVDDLVEGLMWGKFRHLLDKLKEVTKFTPSNPDRHLHAYHLPDDFDPLMREFKDALRPITTRLEAIAKVNRGRRLTSSRKGCFELLAYAKKWLGVPMPPNLSKLNLEALRAKVQECFPDGQFPQVTHISYKGVLAILRGLRLAGHKVTLRAKLPQLLAQVVALVDNWEAQYDILASAGETYAMVVEQAKQDLLAVFKPPTVPVVVQETPAQVDSAFGVAQVPFKGLVVQAA